MKADELLQRSRVGEVIGDGSAQINALLYHLDAALNGQEFAHQWYAVRWKRIHELIREKCPEHEDEACCVMANGTGSVMEPPRYDMIVNALRTDVALARSQLATVRKENKSLRRELSRERGETTN